MYSDNAEFWHPLFVVKGKENIFGAHMFWSFINRKTNARVKRIGRHLYCLRICHTLYVILVQGFLLTMHTSVFYRRLTLHGHPG